MNVSLCTNIRLVVVIAQVLEPFLLLLYEASRLIRRGVVRDEDLDKRIISDLLQYTPERFSQIPAAIICDESIGKERIRLLPLFQEAHEHLFIGCRKPFPRAQ